MNIQQKKYVFVAIIISFLSVIIYDQYCETHFTAWWMVIFTLGLVIYAFKQTLSIFDSKEETTIDEIEPIITRTFTVKGTIENVYNDSLKWLTYIGAGVKNKYPPTLISAIHGKNPFDTTDDNNSVPIKDWLKSIEINITTIGENVQVNFVMDSGLTKTHYESFENRKKEWPELIDEYMLFVGADMSRIQKGYLLQDMHTQVLRQAVGGFVILLIINYAIFSGLLDSYDLLPRLSVIGLDIYLAWRYFVRLKTGLEVINKQQK